MIVAISADGEVSINNQKVPATEYVDRLQRLLASKAAGDKVVFFTPDEKANYGKVVVALDGAKQAGAETLGMTTELTPPPQVAPPDQPPGEGQPPGETAPSPPTPPSTPPQ